MITDMTGVVVVSGGFAANIIVRGMPQFLVVSNSIRQCDGSVHHQDRTEKDLQDKDGVLEAIEGSRAECSNLGRPVRENSSNGEMLHAHVSILSEVEV